MISIEGKTVEELEELNREGLIRRDDLPEWKVWCGMKQRCSNPNETCYRNYGGRGITVCDEWKSDFWAWLHHIGRRPHPWLTQERIDNNDGYRPGNVRWDTRK